jgi:hypothetical protein
LPEQQLTRLKEHGPEAALEGGALAVVELREERDAAEERVEFVGGLHEEGEREAAIASASVPESQSARIVPFAPASAASRAHGERCLSADSCRAALRWAGRAGQAALRRPRCAAQAAIDVLVAWVPCWHLPS